MKLDVVNNSKSYKDGFEVTSFSGPLFVFIIGVVFTVIVFFQIKNWQELELQVSFESLGKSHLTSLKTDIARHEELVNSITGLFSSSDEVTRDEFKSFVSGVLSRYPQIQGFSWNPVIQDSQRKHYENLARSEGLDNFYISEINNDGKISIAPEREDYIAVYYIEPLQKNIKALGFNIASNPSRLKAIKLARDTGETIITERIQLVQDEANHFGYLMLKAVYAKNTVNDTPQQRRNNFTGLAVGVFNFKDWIPLSLTVDQTYGINLLIRDNSAEPEENFLHYHGTDEIRSNGVKYANYAMTKGFYYQENVNVFGREWSFLLTPSDKFLTEHRHDQEWIVLIAGLIISFLLANYLYIKDINSRELAQANRQLQKAIDEVNQLQGIIPICSYCHSIRDDKGAWDQLEAYISRHSDATFSHGICPECDKEVRKKLGLNKVSHSS